jgi:hypothetical protein
MKYNVYNKKLVSIDGDPAWPVATYETNFVHVIETQAPVQKGDYINGNKVIQVEHTSNETKVITSER